MIVDDNMVPQLAQHFPFEVDFACPGESFPSFHQLKTLLQPPRCQITGTHTSENLRSIHVQYRVSRHIPFTLLIFLGLIATGLLGRVLIPGLFVINLGFGLVGGVTGM